ncbi:thiamine pyrophosphate-dependent enzyme [Virgisporangium ochraceum]|uniref:MFS transporter n=1 Tax=Virgisporangium ochraceum TaxID=65505 RepID=A0A8J4EC94_9ACTN|nr:thiamine pyrophosphate-dependent enzyme [Virgisporangium ochraceum]GIJ66627.1 MFS transporter [Virgisporangium ochraceum]
MESVDERLVRRLGGSLPEPASADADVDPELLLRYLDAQLQARHLDLALRWLQSRKEGFYTIGSSGHESNAAVALALRPTDPALLHYRSGGFYAARAGQVPGSTPISDVLHSAAASTLDPISGGRHKVFGNRALNIVPQTSTIASHLPRAMGMAFAFGRGAGTTYPADAVVVSSFGDASLNHSTAAGALNAVGYSVHQGLPMPLLLVCEDNGIGISTRSPRGWVRQVLSSLPGIRYAHADGTDPVRLLAVAAGAARLVRETRTPAVLHLGTVRFMGHAGSDAELAYRSRSEIVADYDRDPILATAAALAHRGILGPAETLERYEAARTLVMDEARLLVGRVARLDSAAAVTAPLTARRRAEVSAAAVRAAASGREAVFGGKPGETRGPLTLAQAINAALHDALLAFPNAQVFGEDVARKGGVYGVTRGLRKAFGAGRVFDTLLDEQSILGLALGGALAGTLPIPEIQYLAYLHNAEDQLRGEAGSLTFFSDGQYANGMVVRIAGLAYQKGFGGHFHNDNSVAVLRDIPGLAFAVASHPATAPALLRQCLALAQAEGRVCVFLEPIALYHTRDLHTDGDSGWLAPYEAPDAWTERPWGEVRTLGDGASLALVTFGNGVPMSLRVAADLAHDGADARVVDLQWLAPLPTASLLAALEGVSRVLVVDETRHSGGVSEAVVAALVDGGFAGRIARVTSVDSYVPLGPAADRVLLGEADILRAARELLG